MKLQLIIGVMIGFILSALASCGGSEPTPSEYPERVLNVQGQEVVRFYDQGEWRYVPKCPTPQNAETTP